QLVPSPLLPVSAAYQFGIGEGGVVPSKVHWGDVRIEGNADLGDALERFPVKDSFAPVNSDPYKESGRRDRWVDFEIGGRVKNPQSKTCGECPHPFGDEGHGNIIQGLGEGNPGWGIDPWDYARLKRFAREWGTIYRPDSEGFVYSEKEGAAGKRLLAIEALEAVRADGSRRPFVFIDTLDGLPPGEGNLATLHLPVRYLKGIYAIHAHVVLSTSGPGRVIEARTPYPEGTEDPSGRRTITLGGIHIDGIFSVTGNLQINGDPWIYGALRVEGEVRGPGEPELWYNADLATGYFPGLPTVMIKKGSWFYQ
ncbi:MAG TPA: hypothetical protein VLB09_06580, partial [Nitrospiria bacterium]|nr:hypothetical protein [Nitrospiria bacterium]